MAAGTDSPKADLCVDGAALSLHGVAPAGASGNPKRQLLRHLAAYAGNNGSGIFHACVRYGGSVSALFRWGCFAGAAACGKGKNEVAFPYVRQKVSFYVNECLRGAIWVQREMANQKLVDFLCTNYYKNVISIP